MASAAATQSAINIPTFQFTDPEKALLATGLILVVASKIFPQLSTSLGWLSQYEQVSTVVSASLAGITFVRAGNRYTSTVGKRIVQIQNQQKNRSENASIQELKGEISAINNRLTKTMSRDSSPALSPIIKRVSFAQTAHAQLNSSHLLQKSFNESRTGVEELTSNFLTQLDKAKDTSEQKEIMRAYIVQFKEEMDEIEAQFAAIGEAYTDLARQEDELNERDVQLCQLAKELESKEQQVATEQSNLQAIKTAFEDLKTQLIQAMAEVKDKF